MSPPFGQSDETTHDGVNEAFMVRVLCPHPAWVPYPTTDYIQPVCQAGKNTHIYKFYMTAARLNATVQIKVITSNARIVFNNILNLNYDTRCNDI